jgi:hypothetical protein
MTCAGAPLLWFRPRDPFAIEIAFSPKTIKVTDHGFL